jgi:5-methylcytosine-specific restriction enzyme subunit McrC
MSVKTNRQCIRLSEWSEANLDGVSLSDSDRRLASKLTADRKVLVDELRSGLRVKARSWVGVVAFEAFDLCISPKLAGGSNGLIEMISHVAGLDDLVRELGERDYRSDEHDDLLDIVASAFIQLTERILRRGLRQDYQEHEAAIPVVRGRILADRQLRRRFGRLDRIECRFDERTNDVLDNRLLAAATRVLRRTVRSRALRSRIHRLHSHFEAASISAHVDTAHIRSHHHYHRLNEHSRGAHELALLVLEGMSVQDLLHTGQLRSFVFMIDMNNVFERFMTVVVRRALRNTAFRVDVQTSASGIIWDIDTRRSFKRIRPDMVMTCGETGARLPIDAKYKLYDISGMPSSDLYQAFLYAFANETEQSRQASLLYPSDSFRVKRIAIKNTQRHRASTINIVGVPLPTVLNAMRTSGHGACVEQLREIMLTLASGATIAR